MQFSYSRVGTFEKCKFQFKLHYLEGLKTIFDCDPTNPLTLGLALHKGIETDVKTAIHEYIMSYPVIDNQIINETIKLKHWIPLVKTMLPEGKHEVKIETKDFIGFIDLITPNEDGSYDLYDFKYSNNIENYMKSGQLHIYKDYFEEIYKKKIRKLFFVFIPKINIRQKMTESLFQFRVRLKKELEKKSIDVKEVEYDPTKRIEFLETIQRIKETKDFDEKNETKLCDWCEFQSYCKKGNDYMIILPKNERKKATINTTPDMWLYGESYSGKTVFMDSFDNNLMLNTDGNIDHITSPVIRIRNEVTVDGRLTKTKLAWEVFKEVIEELEKKNNDFKTITVDLIEDLYEHCRLYMYEKNGWEHESDGAYGKGWDVIKTEFLSTIKRLKNAGYQVVYISKQLTSSITLKSGQEITTFKPNIPDKIANVLAGTVDLTARVVAEGDKHYMSFKTSEVIFGGSRYNFGVQEIPLDYKTFIDTMISAQQSATKPKSKESIKVEEQKNEKKSKEESKSEEKPKEESKSEEKPKRTRKVRGEQ